MNIPSGRFLSSNSIVITLHVAGCLLFLFSPFLLSSSPNSFSGQNILQARMVLDNVLLALFFYLNLFILLPKVFTPYGWPKYLLIALLSFILFDFFIYLVHNWTKSELIGEGLNFNQIRLQSVAIGEYGGHNWLMRDRALIHFPLLMAWALSTSIKFSLDFTRMNQERRERENENLKSELSLLRSQISPHFMFNVLNNLTALARKKSNDLEPIIIKLSQLMRYMLYDSGTNKVSLNTEIEYLQNYIDLQQLRFGPAVRVSFERDVANGVFIEPMLLIPFVENAFKHGTGLIEHPEIQIRLSSDTNSVQFVVKNKFNSSLQEVKDETSGIGLQNVRRRLDLLYPGKYVLNIDKSSDWFIITLNLSTV
jgi:two-component system, LytTR family, sensor kinase